MTELKEVQPDMKLEVVVIGVSDVDRSKAFYENLGWRCDIDISSGDGFRGVQMTPHNSEASIVFGKGIASAKPGAVQNLTLAVDDIDAARNDLLVRGVDISEVFHYARPFNDVVKNPRVSGRDPENRSYFSFASFEDPDGNGWRLQEIKERLPGRDWKATGKRAPDAATLAELLQETAEYHDHYEKTHSEHHWWDWYASYLTARQNGNSPEDAAAAADRYMEEYIHVLAR